MKLKAILQVLVALSLCVSGLSFGQRDDNRNGRSMRGERGERSERDARHDRGDQAQMRHDRNRPGYNPGYRNDDRSRPDYRARPPWAGHGVPPRDWRRDGRGAGPDHMFYRGGRLPLQYRSRQYVVDDWRGHYLSAPPRGYHWVQTGGDYVLVAIATGIILQLLLNN